MNLVPVVFVFLFTTAVTSCKHLYTAYVNRFALLGVLHCPRGMGLGFQGNSRHCSQMTHFALIEPQGL